MRFLDFRLRAMTFDDVPLTITMKQSQHYFPTSELIKDSSEACGWRVITYEKDKAVPGEGEGMTILPIDAQEADVDEIVD